MRSCCSTRDKEKRYVRQLTEFESCVRMPTFFNGYGSGNRIDFLRRLYIISVYVLNIVGKKQYGGYAYHKVVDITFFLYPNGTTVVPRNSTVVRIE